MKFLANMGISSTKMRHEGSPFDNPTTDGITTITEFYNCDVDIITLIRENLKLTVEQRMRNLQNLQRFAEELREAGKKLRITGTKKVREDGKPL